jgi:hypothetical protein
MSISPDTTPQLSALSAEALASLKAKDNPFECLAQPQRADQSFADCHVPELHGVQRRQLLEIIDYYRIEEYEGGESLRPSRVVTLRGDRGSGKTHLLLSLLARSDGLPQLLVRPAFFEPNVDPEEYLLGQFKDALGQEDEFHADRPLDAIARTLTRRLLRQALLGAGPTDRLFALLPKGRGPFGLLWRGGQELLRPLDGLVERLRDPASSANVPGLIAEHGLRADTACRLIGGHLRLHEVGNDPFLAMRRALYLVMARSVLLGDREGLAVFLADGYRQVAPSDTGLRSDLVACLLRVLIEACGLVRLPVVFAFDNLEGLLNPVRQFNGDLTRAFLHCLAQAVDNTRGVLLLVFAEAGLFSEHIVPFMDGFVRHRLEQGVPLSGRGPVFLIDLKEPTPEDIARLVCSRVRPLLLRGGADLPAGFPFSPEFLADLTSAGAANLRNVLLRLRDEYSRVVYGQEPIDVGDGMTKPTPISSIRHDWPKLLESAWSRGLATVRRKVQDSLTHKELHAALGAMMQAVQPLTIDEWELSGRVEANLPVGENPEYGVVTLLDWKIRDSAESVKGPRSLTVAIGFLLAGGPGMAHDLRAKFDFLRERERRVRLVILWPAQKEGEDLVELLPTNTRKTWDSEAANHWRTELRRIDELDVRRILAVLDLTTTVEEIAGDLLPPEHLRGFLQQRLLRVFPLMAPAYGRERTVSDED